MKKYTCLFTGAVIAISLMHSCQKDEEVLPVYDEALLQTEQAFPNSTGELTTITVNGEELSCELINGMYVYQGDIILIPDDVGSTKGAGISPPDTHLWPYGVVYYKINSNFPSQERIAKAIEQWELKSNIVFEECTDEEDYIEFVFRHDSLGSWSYIGMQGGRQEIHIASWGDAGTVVHEIGHAVGLYHEHSKKNRDDYVKIIWDNIEEDKKHNFEKHENAVVTEGFDFNSIMLYGPEAFGKDKNKPTITKLDGSEYTVQRHNLSNKDVEIISQMYSDLHDPIYEFTFGDMAGNANITFDGSYYYSISSGESSAGRFSKFNLLCEPLGSYYVKGVGKGRGIAYNFSDDFLYASVVGGHILRITDLENGKCDTVYKDLMQSEEGSFALSDDGEKLYDFYDGTLRIIDFKTGEVIKTLTDLSCGSDEYYGIAAIAVDILYLYTWDAGAGIVYVYKHSGVLQRTLDLDRKFNTGMSLSVNDGFLFVADDPWYDPGSWHCYNISNPVPDN